MTVPHLNAVGFCAHYSQAGDWAFDYALRLSQRNGLQLNVFHFLTDPFDPSDPGPGEMSREDYAKLTIERERELRMYYDERAGDYTNVGFRLCEDNEWTELHRCLLIREFQVLVLGYPVGSGMFAGRPIEEFANAFVSPVVLIGPDNPDHIRVNSRCEMIRDRLGIPDAQWHTIEHMSV
ncbi:MAG: universal stress protein [candidate division Zixibacteria bacterium]|nr:universal stress protein [candidate division Zixibacteria bacterium]